MKVYEAIERAQKGGCASSTPKDVLMDAVKRLEKQISDKTEVAHGDIDDDTVLLACGGGVADGYDDMYDAYLKREASRYCEAWENYGNYDAVFAIRFRELSKEIIRNRKPKRWN